MKALALEWREPGPWPRFAMTTREIGDVTPSRVLVEVVAASVNPIDVKRSAGHGRRLLSLKGAGSFPLVLGNDIAGIVCEAGAKAPWQPGQRVFGLLPTGGQGTHASHVLAQARWLRSAPPGGLDFDSLGALPYTFTTMALALRAAGLERAGTRNKQILINGAAGGLGQLALQVLVPWGAQITAVCSTPDVAACERLGAVRVLDRRRHALESLPAEFDASLNFGDWMSDTAMLSRLRPDAIGHATTVHPLLENFDRYGWMGGLRSNWVDFTAQTRRIRRRSPRARYQWVTFKPDAVALDELQSMLVAGTVSLPVGLRVPLDHAAIAFDHVRERHAGRSLLLP